MNNHKKTTLPVSLIIPRQYDGANRW